MHNTVFHNFLAYTSLDRTQVLPHIHDFTQCFEQIDDDTLFASATDLRKQAFGQQVSLCAIINARSGKCTMDCAFCSQSVHHTAHIDVFDMLSPTDLYERIAVLRHLPVRRVGIVTSGGQLHMSHVEVIITTLKALPEHWAGRVCASLGKLSHTALARLKDVGLHRFHHNLESSEAYYSKLCTTQTWQERLSTVLRARQCGLQICCGGLFGLGESWQDRIDFALSLKEKNIQNIPLNFLHPHQGTPLAHIPPLTASEALRIIALFRHILPTATLRVCGGRPLILGTRQKDIFAAGANAMMTGHYLTTKGHAAEEDCRMIEAQNLEIIV